MDKDAAAIKEFLSKSVPIATKDDLNRAIEDPRVVDLQLTKGPRSQTAKFRRILSERSLASEFSEWESQKYGLSRVEELVKDHTYSQEKRNGHINKYLQCNTHRLINQPLTKHGIMRGIKLLVFETLVSISGISAILSFGHYKFRSVKYKGLAVLKDIVNKSEWIKDLAETKAALKNIVNKLEWIEDLAKTKAAWLDGCQTEYNGM